MYVRTLERCPAHGVDECFEYERFVSFSSEHEGLAPQRQTQTACWQLTDRLPTHCNTFAALSRLEIRRLHLNTISEDRR